MPNGEITAADVQSLSGPEELCRFLGTLGYNVSNPVEQTAASLGVAERFQHGISQAHRVAAERLEPSLDPALEVYWFEVGSLTADLRKAVVSAFRNKPAQTLLILTTKDFDPIDFVLVQRAPRQGTMPGGPAISHRLFSLDRRNPTRVHLRVLNRMANKAGDPYAQYDRIKDAFRLAEWSEDEFNNRNLFSDYFLKNRLPRKDLFPVFHRDVRPARREVSDALKKTGDTRNLTADELEDKLVKPLMAALGFEAPKAARGQDAADYLLEAKKDSASATVALLVYPWDRSLDRKDDRDPDRPEDVPGIRVVRALEHHGASWAILTNGKDWRLYCAAAHSRASNYYEVDLPETLEREDLTAFRYYYLFFRAAAFIPVAPLPDDESGRPACFLDHLRAGSAAFAKELGDRLRDHIFKEVFPYLAQGFVDYRKKKYGETTAAGDSFLDEVYDATLTLLYRLLFLLYAESLDLVPVHEPAYAAVSLTKLKREIAKAAGSETDAVEKRLKDRFNQTDTTLYRRLGDLFKVIDEGSKARNVPAYNGGLFETSPQRADRSREAAAARFLKKHRVPDFFLARALDLLARSEDAKSHALVSVDYKALGVRQLGHVYEGLLVYHVVIPRDDWEKRFQRKGLRVALVPSNKERKSSGSYFTPEHIVKYIVANTVGPLLTEKFEALAPKLRTIQREYRDTREFERKRAEKMRSRPPSDEDIARRIAREHEKTVWDLFDLKVLDPAMGSGHFLVETVDFITDKVLDFLAGFPWNPVQVLIDGRVRQPIIDSLDGQGVKINEDRLTDVNLIKRLVMKRCVYGVDLNPMAVELAKVSLWLDCFTLGAPLSFMDHHLKCGNSLIGATIEDLKKASEGWMYGIPMEPLERATRNMELIADLTDATLAEVTKSAETYAQVLSGVQGYRALLDCLTAEHFGVKGASALITEGSDLDLEHWSKTVESLKSREQGWVKKATKVSRERRFFHWDISFPDVFFTRRRPEELRAFDAVVGNPPYMSAIEMSRELDRRDKIYWKGKYDAATGAYDIYLLFLNLSLSIVGPARRTGMITPNKWLAAPYGVGFRDHVVACFTLRELFDVSRVKVFDDPSVYPVISIMEKSHAKDEYEFVVKRAFPRRPLQTVALLSGLLTELPENIWGFLLSDAIELVLKMKAVGERLDEWGAVNATSTAGEADAITPAISDEQEFDGERLLHFINTGAIDRHENLWGAVRIEHGGKRFWKPVVDLNSPYTPVSRRTLYGSEKLIFAKIAFRLEAFADRQGTYASVNTNALHKPKLPLEIVAGVANSAPVAFLYDQYFSALAMSGGYLQFQAPQLRVVPVPRAERIRTSLSTALPQNCEVSHQHFLELHDTEFERLASPLLQQAVGQIMSIGEMAKQDGLAFRDEFANSVDCADDLLSWKSLSSLRNLEYMGWTGRYPEWHPDEESAEGGHWFPNNVAPPIHGDGPAGAPWDLIARVYPSYPLPGIDHESWEAGAWEDLCDLLRKNKSKIGNDRIRADLTGRGAITNPTGRMRKLQETFFKYHRDIRANRAKAAEIDFLIDRIVFRLFDLTLDEQKLILSRVGPGRPLPPRRGRRKKSSSKKKLDPTPTLFD